MTDLPAKGWYSGDNHIHMNYGGNYRSTPQDLMFMADAEDLNIVTELVANEGARLLDYQFFTGKPHLLSNAKRVLFVNQELRGAFYGHISLINLSKHLVLPFASYEGTDMESLYPSSTDLLRVAKQQGALGAYVHPFFGNEDPLKTDLGLAKGFPGDLALGTLDYHEVASAASWAAYLVWHHALNCGFRLPIVGGEDSIVDRTKTAVVDKMRAFAFMGAKPTWEGWIEAIRGGHTFVTNGPPLELEVNGRMPGKEIRLPAGGGSIRIRGSVQSIVPLDRAVLLINGEEHCPTPVGAGDPRLSTRLRPAAG